MSERDLVVAVRLKADGSGLVGQVRQSTAEVANFTEAATEAGKAGRDMAAGTAAAGTGARDVAGAMAEAGAAAEAMAVDQRQVTVALATAGAEVAELTARIVALEGVNASLVSQLGALETAAQAMAADQRQAASATEQLRIATDGMMSAAAQLRGGVEALAADQRQATGAVNEGSGAARALASDLARLRAEIDPAGEAQRKFAQATDLATTAVAKGLITQDQADEHLRRLRAELDGGTKAAGSNAYAIRNVGQQFGDFGLQVASGQDVARSFGQQAGQLGYALSEMEGRLGSVGKFLVGPWGIAFTVGAAVAAPFIEKLFEAGKAAEEQEKALDAAAKAADSYGSAQSLLGKVIDLTTGKLKTQNAVLIQTIKLQAQANILSAQQKQKDATEALAGVALPNLAEGAAASLSGVGSTTAGSVNYAGAAAGAQALISKLGPLKAVVQDYVSLTQIAGVSQGALDKGLDATLRRIDGLAKSGRLAGRDAIEAKQAVLALGTTLNDQRANKEVLDAIDGKGIAADLKPYARDKKPRAPKKPKSTDGIEKFGDDAATKIADIVGQYNADPTTAALEKTNKQVRALDDLIADLGRRKPPNFGELIASAEQAKVKVRDGIVAELANAFAKPKTLADQARAAFAQVDAIQADAMARKYPGFEEVIASAGRAKAAIQEGLQRPFEDYVRAQADDLQVLQLQARGRDDEATALKQVLALEKQMGPLTQAQKNAVLETVQAQRAEQRQIDINRAHVQLYVDALGGIRTVVDDATQSFVKGDLGQLIKAPGKLVGIFQQLKGEEVMESLFGDSFRDLSDQAQGLSPLKQASELMADALDQLPPHVADAGAALETVAPSTKVATDALGGLATQAKSAADALAGVGSPATTPGAIAAGGAGLSANIDGNLPSASARDVVVTGNVLPKLTRSPEDLFAGSLAKLSTSVLHKLGVGNADDEGDQAKRIGDIIGKKASAGIQGAATGAFVSGIANTFGVHLSSGGSQIGGALGGLTGLPGGSIVGSVLGGIVGNLFKAKAKPGGVTIGNVDGSAGQTGTSGSDAKLIAASGSLGNAVSSGLNKIVDQLGGELGQFSVSIGKYKDDLRVNVNGKALGGVKNSGAVGFGDDEQAAESYAIAQAIAQGAVQGLSPAVAKALQSSTDIDKAVAEAVKVQNLESTLGGITGQINKLFSDEAKTAAERVDLAKKYGLDLLAVEKLNAEERADLITSTLKSRIGSLQDVLDSLTTGDLSAGSAVDKRTALKKQIDAAQADAEAGKDGAADTLAQLFTQLLSTDKDQFGTAGTEYASDRAAAEAGINRVIQIENDRINAAAGVTSTQTDAINAGNALADEGNDLLSGIKSGIDTLVGYVVSDDSGYSSGGGVDTRLTRRNLA